jgi:flagellar assembly factor FliW
MRISTVRFGDIEIKDSDLIYFPGAILGFPASKSYFIIEAEDSAFFAWLQSVQEPELCFVVTDPFLFRKDYSVNLTSKEIELLAIKEANEINILSIVSINSRNNGQININLMAPLVVNATTRVGYQIIKEEYTHYLRFNIKPILKEMANIEEMDRKTFEETQGKKQAVS